MAEPEGHFPLSMDETPLPGQLGFDRVEDGSDAGASGTSTGGVVLSRGALIAIIVVVVVVALSGSKRLHLPRQRQHRNEKNNHLSPTLQLPAPCSSTSPRSASGQ